MKKNVLVVDNEKSVLDAAGKFNDDYFNLVGVANNGRDCLQYIENYHIDILVMSMALPLLDGYGVIYRLNTMTGIHKPKVFVVSNITSPLFVNIVMKMGITNYYPKPMTIDEIKRAILYEDNTAKALREGRIAENSDIDIDMEIAHLFVNIGIPAHIKGYHFLRTAIARVVTTPSLLKSITKELYPTIATVHNTTASKVERAIRHAIEVLWTRGNIDSLNELLGRVGMQEKPTNGEFIALIADKIMVDSDMRWYKQDKSLYS